MKARIEIYFLIEKFFFMLCVEPYYIFCFDEFQGRKVMLLQHFSVKRPYLIQITNIKLHALVVKLFLNFLLHSTNKAFKPEAEKQGLIPDLIKPCGLIQGFSNLFTHGTSNLIILAHGTR